MLSRLDYLLPDEMKAFKNFVHSGSRKQIFVCLSLKEFMQRSLSESKSKYADGLAALSACTLAQQCIKLNDNISTLTMVTLFAGMFSMIAICTCFQYVNTDGKKLGENMHVCILYKSIPGLL